MISKRINPILLFVFGFLAQAQQILSAAGSDASRSGGSVSYTVA